MVKKIQFQREIKRKVKSPLFNLILLVCIPQFSRCLLPHKGISDLKNPTMDYYTNTHHIHTFCNFFFSLNSVFSLYLYKLRHTALFLTATQYVTIWSLDLNITWPVVHHLLNPHWPEALCEIWGHGITDCITVLRASCKSVLLRNYRKFTNNQSLCSFFLYKSLPFGLSLPFQSYHVLLL